MTTTEKHDYNITGASGEFFVAAELSRRNIIATLTIKNTPQIDVIATSLKNGMSANLQVKTKSERNKQGWKLNSKIDIPSEIKNHFYVFVDLHDPKALPEYYIIPNNIFANFSEKKHKTWLSITGRDGKEHKDNSVRNFKPYTNDKAFAEKYRNNWEILSLF